MMPMDCSQVRAALKAFQEDMLSPEGYRSFVEHMDACPDCRAYVRSFGSLSTGLWKLGDIEAPADFVSTVIFKARHAQRDPAASAKPAIPEMLAVGIIIVIVVLALVFGVFYARKAMTEPRRPVPAPAAQTADENGLKPVYQYFLVPDNQTGEAR